MNLKLEEKDVLDIFRRENALWSFDRNGDPKAPHAEWTGGLCADGYTNSRLVLNNPKYTALLASMLIEKVRPRFMGRDIDWVVGSAYSAITFSYEVAKQMGVRHGFTRKSPSDPKEMVWDQSTIPRYNRVLQCEELIATLNTTIKVREAVTDGNLYAVLFQPQVITIFHYPNFAMSERFQIISLATRTDIRTWPPERCPLCAQGSPRIPPSLRENWARLIASGKQ